MTKIKEIIEKLYGFTPSSAAISRFFAWKELFIKYNSHTNLMSKNDTAVIFEKHVLDSLSITKCDGFKSAGRLVDVGCGGGFPCLILALFFENIEIIGIESIQKKARFLSFVKNELGLDNFSVLNERFEKIPSLNADILTNRAVGKIADVWKMANHHLKTGGCFVSYKALSAVEEAKNAHTLFKNLSEPIFISYKLPLLENFTRELVVFQKL